MIDTKKVLEYLGQVNTGEIAWDQFIDHLHKMRDVDNNTCQVCKEVGEDRRNLWIACLYELHEISPLFDKVRIDGKPFYLLRICKDCRADFMTALGNFVNRK